MTALPAMSLGQRLTVVARDIKLSHTVFALPFALLATFLAAGGWPRLSVLGLILLCMVLARTFAMSVNRWADRNLDAANPRTAARALPRGAVSPMFMLGTAITCGVGFVVAAGGFWLAAGNPWPVLLAPVVLAYLAGYSYMKRLTALCHVYLGTVLALSPVAAAVAVGPGYLATPVPWLLAAMVTGWVAGFDVIYALQDVVVDQAAGLYSLPSRLGPERALWVSRALHAGVGVCLASLIVVSDQLATGFAIASVLAAALLVTEHVLIWRSAERHLAMAFFTLNGIISVLLGLGGIVDVVL